MEIQEHRHGAVTVIKPIGVLTGADAERLRAKVDEIVAATLGRFVIDTSGVAAVDSRALEIFEDVAAQLGENGQVVRLCGTGETLREVLELTELSSLFEHYADVSTAVRSFL